MRCKIKDKPVVLFLRFGPTKMTKKQKDTADS